VEVEDAALGILLRVALVEATPAGYNRKNKFQMPGVLEDVVGRVSPDSCGSVRRGNKVLTASRHVTYSTADGEAS
jgi:hypothetical protein